MPELVSIKPATDAAASLCVEAFMAPAAKYIATSSKAKGAHTGTVGGALRSSIAQTLVS